MKKRIWLVLCVLLLGIASSCQKQDENVVEKTKASAEADVAAIKALYAEFVVRYNAEDFQKLVSIFYMEDAVLMSPNAPAIRTKEAILQSYQKSRVSNIEHIDATVVEDVRVCGDLAFASGTDTGTTTPRSGGEPVPYSVKWLYVFERQSDGAWKCLYEMWNDNSPPPQTPEKG